MACSRQNGGVESFRVLLMFGITLLHQLCEFGVGMTFICRVLHVCVVGFVFISGWYGVKFSGIKILRLYGVGLFAAVLTAFAIKSSEGGIICVRDFLSYFWFLHAYAVLMCLSPILNLPFDDGISEVTRRKILMPIILVVFGYCFISGLPVLRNWMPHFAGSHSHTFLTLTGIYLAARWCRVLRLDRIPSRACVVIALLSAIPCGFGFGKYNSPFALVLAGALFLLFHQLELSEWASKVISFLARSMFSVYLLQIGFVGILLPPIIKGFGVNGYIGAFISAISVFLACTLLDIFRRLLLFESKKIFAIRI